LLAARGRDDARVSERGARRRDRTPARPPRGGSPRGAGRRDRRGGPDGSHAGPRGRPRARGATVRRADGERGRTRRHRWVLWPAILGAAGTPRRRVTITARASP